jgi:hypothetical protein
MTATHQSNRDIAIRVGRAYLQMITAAHILLEGQPIWTEALLLKLVQALCGRRLQRLLELLPEDVAAEILARQDDGGEVGSFSSN